MMNIEKYIDDILKTNNCDFGFNKRDRKIIKCDTKFCKECLFNPKNRKVDEPSCNVAKFKWLISEYKEPIRLNRLEYEILKWLEKEGYKFIFRNPNNNLLAHNNAPKKVINGWANENSFNCWVSENQYKTLLSFNELFKFIKWEDEEPTSIDELLKNCEVTENA